ncbi:MAG: chemotaxis protein CheW [Thermodesulfovibrio sp.]|uniref:chemotaxis protein CheW n=1 Tax=unclassified Thermodesulfovibrio TaxID=2645936 RepID=UPI000839FE14|nr:MULTISPECIES: chemotaxis protein CheW [unclassified Thermodesulfovibrio]MDI1472379.1 chemotaxis protein CheW [Thermodesulfovibrio sp. 1176]MDI6714244.1 chemotaxis protein CheW [Thermodesulfovibrio sp.]ODA43942.1 Positive regulator of CheA protein activity (CheW) [Thermodesulfovibrio sp. N1]
MVETEVVANEFVTFLIDREIFAINMAPVQEIIRVPEIVKVPKSPPSLMGLANLRGKVLPIINLRKVFGLEEKTIDESSRVIVIDLGQTLGFLVDNVSSVIDVDETKIETSSEIKSIVKSDFLKGVIKDIAKFKMVMILDIEKVIEKEFSEILQGSSKEYEITSKEQSTEEEILTDERQLVSFTVSDEEYAILIENIQEIVQIPEHITKVPNSEQSIIGIMNLRDKILPLASLRRLFGFPEEQLTEQNRIVVLSMGNLSVGIVVDSVKEVLRVSESIIEPVPSIILKDEKDFEIAEICRLNEGKRLVSIISVSNLFKHKDIKEALNSLETEKGVEEKKENEEILEDEEQFVVFKLDEQEYAVPIESVQEIVRIPEGLTHVPKTPDFVEGVINLRGNVLPVIDLRKRFDIGKKQMDEHQRIMVFVIDNVSVGFIVDSVNEVLKIPKSVIQKSPELSAEQAKIFTRVANLEKQGRIIQIIEPKELLNKEELKELEKSETEE